MPDYSKGKVYKIVCNKTGLIYVGSTCEPTLARRLADHVQKFKQWKDGKYKGNLSSLEIIKNANYDIILIENYPCKLKDELHARERHYIEAVNCVNKVIPTRTKKEHYEQNKEQIIAKSKEYRVNNEERVKETNKKYYENNKDEKLIYAKIYRDEKKDILQTKYTCDCGGKYTFCNKSRHNKTKNHQAFLNSQVIEV